MPIRAHYRKDLALSQLQTALRLYFDAGDRGSVITLAGAADEIFGKLLAASGRDNSLRSLIAAVSEIQQKLFGEAVEPKQIADCANAARNSLKHWDMGNTEIVKFDLEVEARDMLNRAIDNYWMLEHKLTSEMELPTLNYELPNSVYGLLPRRKRDAVGRSTRESVAVVYPAS